MNTPPVILADAVSDVISGKPDMFHRVYLAAYSTMKEEPWALSHAVTKGVQQGYEQSGVDKATCLIRSHDLIKPLELAAIAQNPICLDESPMVKLLETIIDNSVA